jgi:hypothetical protein
LGAVAVVRNVGPAEDKTRVIAVLATSAADAEKKAKVLFGGESI